MKPARKTARSFLSLTPAERDREVARFDRPIDIGRDTRPLTPKERARFEKSRQKPSISVYMFKADPRLLDEAFNAARKRGMSLDKFINQAIRGMIAFGQR
ncbi:MAG TPA: hypothetical protein VL992_10140 [Tepidisphaeraceae bacterium]|nr:hypothetical protein [Tepidisphaeraceae bacterium]